MSQPKAAAPAAPERDPLAELQADAGPDERLTAALAAAQAAFPAIPKTQTAQVKGKNGGPGYSYKYADLADVLGAVRPVLARYGLAIVQRTLPHTGGITLETTLRHVAGGTETTIVELGARSGDPQAFGGALSYLRRYELCTLLGIAPEDDTDAQHVEPTTAQAPPAELPEWTRPCTQESGERMVAELRAIVGDAPADELVAHVYQAAGGTMPELVVNALRGLAKRVRALQDPAPEPAPAGPVEPPLSETLDAPPAAPPREAPGTLNVDREALPTDPAKLSGVLRAAGCSCPNPALAERDETARDTACPLVGHGLPF